jgi:hypothetical protein
MKRQLLSILVSITFVSILAATGAWAGSPHFTQCSVQRTDNSLEVFGKEAGLGNETQVEILVTATAQCINPGSKHPKAANKEDLSDQNSFPVQNGKALFDFTLTPTITPSCSPPMTIVFTDVTVCDVDHDDVCCDIGGTF